MESPVRLSTTFAEANDKLERLTVIVAKVKYTQDPISNTVEETYISVGDLKLKRNALPR
jgi:hypothetical protein